VAQQESLVIVALVRDLMFASRIGAEAKAAGIGRVLPRSRFVQILPELLREV